MQGLLMPQMCHRNAVISFKCDENPRMSSIRDITAYIARFVSFNYGMFCLLTLFELSSTISHISLLH